MCNCICNTKGKIKMIINKINIDKITKAFELVCPLLKENLVTEAYIVGSVAKGTAKKDSDIDIYLINPIFKEYDTELKEDSQEPNVRKIINLLKNYGVVFDVSYYAEHKETLYNFEWQMYKNEVLHFMYDYESESIKKVGEYIEITEDLCNQINELE